MTFEVRTATPPWYIAPMFAGIFNLKYTEHGLKPLYRGYEPKGTREAIDTEFRRVLKDAFGPDGDTKRRVALEISKKLKETWEEDGGAMIELRRMLRENFL
ncbi:hypothetical protein Clacol_005206 [Clathrus columnatus]|uniref:Uncharacterized protein n=1 Tax=Clathrus columnatus TaxID=1419009 RepID=A0AAV5ABL5_9AGAM|nr:hypothetical protein Clacol_005206 [Clathrus columnatus]